MLKPGPEGGYTVNIPALPGCITYGKDLEEAKVNAKETIELYIESLKKHGEEIPLMMTFWNTIRNFLHEQETYEVFKTS
ncbi:MAG: hypothetical protein JWP44_611 [Mucilaginibacter sp.]|nr:hypothetical protein [Mucilaginibacter sp.]